MAALLRAVYAIAVIAWIGWCVLKPAWIGRMYHRDIVSSDWKRSGVRPLTIEQ